MKVAQLSPKAREAFGKSLIDVGVGIFKGIMLLFTVAPMTFLLKGGLDGANTAASFSELWKLMRSPMYFAFLALLVLAFFIGDLFRREGLRHIHEAETTKG